MFGSNSYEGKSVFQTITNFSQLEENKRSGNSVHMSLDLKEELAFFFFCVIAFIAVAI